MAASAGLEEVRHPLLAIGAGRHGGRSELVTLRSFGLDMLFPQRCSSLRVHVRLTLFVGPND